MLDAAAAASSVMVRFIGKLLLGFPVDRLIAPDSEKTLQLRNATSRGSFLGLTWDRVRLPQVETGLARWESSIHILEYKGPNPAEDALTDPQS
jgi:hypothetical protein